jgi:hypothetical protein
MAPFFSLSWHDRILTWLDLVRGSDLVLARLGLWHVLDSGTSSSDRIGSQIPDYEKQHSTMNSEDSRFKEEIPALPQPLIQSALPSFSVRAPPN